MKTKSQLIQNVIGQLNGIHNMLEADKDCFAVLTQLKAAKSALSNVIGKYLEDELSKCSAGKVEKKQKEKIKKLIIELTKNN